MKKEIKKEAIIKISNLNVKFKNFLALKNINLEIYKSQNIALVGSNGAGKTTLIETILGINKKETGAIELNIDKKNIGVQFQDSNIPEGLSARDIIIFFNKINNFDIQEEDFLQLLKIFNMEDFIDRQAHGLSGGQRQKLNILLATIHKPKLLILDEISTGLDITTKNDLLNYILKYFNKSSSTIISISHDPKEIELLTDRFIFMYKGEIIYDSPTKNVIKEFGRIEDAFIQIPKKYYKKTKKQEF